MGFTRGHRKIVRYLFVRKEFGTMAYFRNEEADDLVIIVSIVIYCGGLFSKNLHGNSQPMEWQNVDTLPE